MFEQKGIHVSNSAQRKPAPSAPTVPVKPIELRAQAQTQAHKPEPLRYLDKPEPVLADNPFEAEDAVIGSPENPFEEVITQTTPVTYKPMTQHRKSVIDKNTKRYKIMYELVQTEINYSRDLKLMNSIYRKPMISRGLFSKKQVEAVFDGLDDLLKFVDSFSVQLQNSLESDEIGLEFVNSQSQMRIVYTLFCENNQESLKKIAQWQSSDSVKQFFKDCQMQLQGKSGAWDLSSFFIKPVQRLLKYPLLLKEIIKETQETHPDYVNLKKSLDFIERVAKSIN